MEFINSLLPYYPPVSESISKDILEINEFKELIGRTNENIQGFRGYQIFVERFMSPFTPYKEILIKHSMGSGKTCTAFLILYIHLKGFGVSSNKHPTYFLLLAHNSSQLKNFKEGLKKCATYLQEKDTYIESYIDKYLKEKTFGSINRKDIAQLLKNVSIVIIDEAHAIHLKKDETSTDQIGKESLYSRMKYFLGECKKQQKRIVLMTGTPISNHFSKLFQLMDLILPPNLQFSLLERSINSGVKDQDLGSSKEQRTIDNFYFQPNGSLKPEMVKEITKRFAGRISSLQKVKTKIRQIEMGGFYNLDLNERNFTEHSTKKNVWFDKMIGYQRSEYIKLLSKLHIEDEDEDEETGSYKREETMIFFTFPKLNNTELKFSDLIDSDQNKVRFIKNKYVTWNNRTVLFEEVIKEPAFLREHSILYYNVLVEMGEINASLVNPIDLRTNYLSDSQMKKRSEEAVFYYNDVVAGTSNKLFSLIMRSYGFTQLTSKKSIEKLYSTMLSNEESLLKEKKEKRFAVISSNFGSTSDIDIEYIMNIFTHPLNKKGEYLRMIIGSKKLAFGYNLINGRQAHVVLQWNAPLMNQAIARLLRETSNFEEEEEKYVRIYKHFIGIEDVKRYSPNNYILFERRLNSMVNKETKNAKILHLLDSMAVDCFINREFHTSVSSFDNTRECNFMPCIKNYDCEKYIARDIDLEPKPLSNFSKTDNSFIFHESQEKINNIITVLDRLWKTGLISISLKDLTTFINKEFPYVTQNEIYFYLSKLITEQHIFTNKFGMESVIGSLNDIIFFKKSSIWINSPVAIVYDIIKPLVLEHNIENFLIDEAFVLKFSKEDIIEWIKDPSLDDYKELNILARTYIFENIFPVNNLNIDDYIINEISNEEYNNFISIEELSNSSESKKILQGNKFKNVLMVHSLIANFHIKSHAVKKNIVFSEGMKIYTTTEKEWKYLKIDDVIASVLGSAMANKVLNKSTTILLKEEPITYWFNEEKIPVSVFDSSLNFVLTKDLKTGDIKRKDLTEGKKERKGQNCKTINKKRLAEYLKKYFTELERIYNHLRDVDSESLGIYISQILKKFNIDTKKPLLSVSLLEISKPLEELFNDASQTVSSKCQFLLKLQQAIYQKDKECPD